MGFNLPPDVKNQVRQLHSKYELSRVLSVVEDWKHLPRNPNKESLELFHLEGDLQSVE